MMKVLTMKKTQRASILVIHSSISLNLFEFCDDDNNYDDFAYRSQNHVQQDYKLIGIFISINLL